MNGHEAVAVAGNLINPLGTPEFFDTFYRECRSTFDNDQCNIFFFPRKGNPACLFTTAIEPRMRKITRSCASEYVSRGYRRDRVIRAAASVVQHEDRLFLHHLRAQEISDPIYRRVFYSLAEVSQKISLTFRSSVGIYYINLYRNFEQNGYTENDIATLSQAGEILCKLVAKHHLLTASEDALGWRDSGDAPDRYATLIRIIRQALLADPAGLTEREAEICAAVACGMTSQGIALEYGISINTVATHRKRAYAKLQISSQNELFARFYNLAGRFALARTQR